MAKIIPADIDQLHHKLLHVPEELQGALLTRIMLDQEEVERDSAYFLLTQIGELMQVKKEMKKWVEQGSYQHATAVTKVVSTINTLIKEVNKLLASYGDKSNEGYQSTYDPDSEEFKNAVRVIEGSIISGFYYDDHEQETAEERLFAIDEITQLTVDEIERLDSIEREASLGST